MRFRHLLAAALLLVFVSPVSAQTPPKSAVFGIAAGATSTAATVTVNDGSQMVPMGVLNPTTHTLALVNAIQAGTVLNTAYSMSGPINAVLASNGPFISFCPPLSCVTTPSADHQRAAFLVAAQTQDDGHSEEQTLGVVTTIGTGYAKPWATSTVYAVGDNIRFTGANTVYRATTAGTSASSGTGPTGTGSGIVDGTVVWAWINASAIDSKVGIYNETSVIPGAGNSWGQANNVNLAAGVIPTFNVNTEYDFTNNSGSDCVPGTANCIGLYVVMGGANKSTAGVNILSNNSSAYSALWGLRLNGAFLASDADIEDDSNGAVGLAFGVSGFGGATHSVAVIKDVTTSPITLQTSGTKSASVLADTSTTPAYANLAGTYSYAAVSTVGATASVALATASGQNVCLNGTTQCFAFNGTNVVAPPSFQYKQTIGGSSANAVQPAATTNYLMTGMSGTESIVSHVTARAGVFKNLYAVVTVAPGGTDTQTITWRVNGAATSISCTITGAATTCNDTTHTAGITAGQTYDIQIVSSAAAASTIPKFGIELDD